MLFRKHDHKDTLHEALSRLPAALLPDLKGLSDEANWVILLQQRVSFATKTLAQQQAFRQHSREDQRRVRKRFPALHAAAQEDDASWQSSLAKDFRQWCKERSWQMCAQCHCLCKRKLKEKHLALRTCQASMKMCRHCKSGIGYRTVQKEDIPMPLRGLSKVAVDVLRPLHPWTGPHVRAQHGYRFHSDMIKFRWKPVAVEAAIRQLRGTSDHAPAKAAYDYLMQSDQSSYKEWTEMHLRFLQKQGPLLTGNTEDPRLQLPRRVLESAGIECAVWPHLYPRTDMCETYVRSADVRRQARHARAKKGKAEGEDNSSSSTTTSSSDSSNSSSSDSDSSGTSEPIAQTSVKAAASAKKRPAAREAAQMSRKPASNLQAKQKADFSKKGRNSAKASFLAKVLGPITDYGADFELFQFVYDLWLWSSLGAKKNTMKAPMRMALAGQSFSPEYWKVHHAGLVDMAKQLGHPTLFVTISPYEWTFPYHEFLKDEMQKSLRSTLHLPIAETLHIAHILVETVEGVVAGGLNLGQSSWKNHLLGPKDGSCAQTILSYYARLEFQDGKRKRFVGNQEAKSQFYHGRGTPHVHLLVWLRDTEKINFPATVSAVSPDDNPVMQALVEGSQRSREDAELYFDNEKHLLHLQHRAEDHCKWNSKGEPEGVRAYLPDLLGSLQCHTDVQSSDGSAMLLRYVAGYVAKFSDSFATEWLNDAASDYSIARRVLTDYHPGEPEMVLQLAQQWFPLASSSASMRKFIVPVPWDTADLPKARPAVCAGEVATRRHAAGTVSPQDERQRRVAALLAQKAQSRGGRRSHNTVPRSLGGDSANAR